MCCHHFKARSLHRFFPFFSFSLSLLLYSKSLGSIVAFHFVIFRLSWVFDRDCKFHLFIMEIVHFFFFSLSTIFLNKFKFSFERRSPIFDKRQQKANLPFLITFRMRFKKKEFYRFFLFVNNIIHIKYNQERWFGIRHTGLQLHHMHTINNTHPSSHCLLSFVYSIFEVRIGSHSIQYEAVLLWTLFLIKKRNKTCLHELNEEWWRKQIKNYVYKHKI